MKNIHLITIGIAVYLFTGCVHAGIKDFDLSDPVINIRDLKSGGPEKDGIPAINNPFFIDGKVIQQVESLDERDLVIGVSLNEEHKAYPLKILNWHEIVNDTIDGVPIAVTYCPLTRSAVVFNRELDGNKVSFGVSGLLFNNNMVMYDRTYNGLWPQLTIGSVTGKHASKKLHIIPSVVTTLKEWKADHPDGKVLSRKTGHVRDYTANPYQRYHESSSHIRFPMEDISREIPLKSLVIGIRIGEQSKAYPIEMLHRMNEPLKDAIGGKEIHIRAFSDETAQITDDQGNLLPGIVTYWFAWKAFNEESLLYGQHL